MPNCPSCAADLVPESRFCGNCGADVTTEVPTATRTAPSRSAPPSSLDQARFTAGTILDERYRIVGLLGRGGMGEVYRAEDLKLGQPVALKFLPVSREKDESRLARLLNEVRLARTVSHPNVCRVYDVGEYEGTAFMAMEYVDGEDLASLLRRIGRLPQEKGLEIARQTCAGLAAAHEQGILHRDLKPANIMIDGQGRVKLADFGLAGLGSDLVGEEARAGTPAYMAPEQLAGREVTVRSDVYALGLVLYEIFTGEAVFKGSTLDDIVRQHDQPAPTQASTMVSGLDDTVDRVVQRCMAKDPAARPASALAVAAALPGGDPLAAALAAGETPSPEMVAEAGSAGGLKPPVAWALLIGFVAMLAANIAGLERFTLVSRTDLPLSAGVLESKARDMLVDLGYDDPVGDSILDFELNEDYIRELQAQESIGARLQLFDQAQPSAIRFAYRQSPGRIVYRNPGSVGEWVKRTAGSAPGDVRLRLDPHGRLVQLETTLPDSVGPASEPSATDWNRLLDASGFDPTTLAEAEPEWLPTTPFDTRRAWTGVYPEAKDVPIRIEAASLAGRPVHFRIIEPWTRPRVENSRPLMGPNSFEGIAGILVPLLWIGSLFTIGVLALRNIRAGRGDRRTAVRFAFALAAVRIMWFLFAKHYPSLAEIDVLIGHVAWTMWRFGFAYAFYVALEPYARKLWPRMLTSWVRLFNNRFGDPLVGRDVLVGLGLAGLTMGLFWGSMLLMENLGLAHSEMGLDDFALENLRGLRGALLGYAGTLTNVAFPVIMMVTLVFLMRIVVRRDVLTLIPLVLIAGLVNLGNHPFSMIVGAIYAVVTWVALFRFGLLTYVTFYVASEMITALPLTFEMGAWWATPTWIVMATVLGLAAWSFRVSLAGRAAFRDRVLED